MRHAFDLYENICNLKFVEGTFNDVYALSTNFELVKTTASHWSPSTTTLGSFYIPTDGFNEAYGPLSGHFNYEASSWKYALAPGGDGFYTLIHELGHALGMHHPFDAAQKFPGVGATYDLGDNALNQGIWTVMSYSPDWNNSPQGSLLWGEAMTPMTFDVATMQALYGANTTYKTGNDTYVLPTTETTGTGWQCIWDAGGVDTISDAGASSACQINLNAYPKAGGLVSEPFVSYNIGSQIAGGFTIADGVTIENAIGGNGNDVLIGNAVANSLTGGAGNDTLTGSAGADQFIFNAALSATSNVDTITDFSVADGDKIDLSASVFTKLAVASSLNATQFISGEGVTAGADANGYIIYDTTWGNLYYDSDGKGANAAVLFATLQNKPTNLTASQFVVI